MRRIAHLTLALACLAATAIAEPVRIGIVVDGPWGGNEEVRAGTEQEIVSLAEGEFEVEFPRASYLVGDWTLASARENLATLLADPEVDLIITWGILASHTVCCYGRLPKPVVAPVIINRELQEIPRADGASGVENLSYVVLPSGLGEDLGYFRRLVPFQHVAILISAPLLEAIPQLEVRTRAQLADLGLTFEYVPVGDSAEATLAALSPATDAVYLWPLFHLAPEEAQRLVDGFIARRLPSFSALGGIDIERGILASRGSADFIPRLIRRTALNVQRILLGEPAATIPVEFDERSRLSLNMATARAIGVSPTWDLLLEADVLHREVTEGVEVRTLAGSARAAVAANLDLAVEERVVAAGAQEVAQARARLLPQLEVDALGVVIDDDRAAASLGSQAERTTSAGVTLSQLIYSDAARANLQIQRSVQRAREDDRKTRELDVALAAAATYLNLLRAQTLVQVQRNNLALTRENLDLAEIRRSVGTANPAEVFRWESQVAIDRKELVEALGSLRAARIALNRVLHRPLDTPFRAQEVGVRDAGLMTSHPRFRGATETERRFEAFTAFMVDEGLAASPELGALDELIAAGERALTAARRAFYAPTLGLEASLDEILSRGGAGSTAPALPLFELPRADDHNWSVALRAALPLFEGGGRIAERAQARIELERLRLERTRAAERIEQRIRTAMAATWAAFPGVQLSRQAAGAARKNLDLVADAYARGAVSILDLLDAQNAARNADELAANSVYDFLIELMEAERSTAAFHFFMTPEEREAWFDRLELFFAERGIPALDPRLPAAHDLWRGGD